MVSNHLEPKPNGVSPFDTIKNTRPDGTEYWSARDLMEYIKRLENLVASLEQHEAGAREKAAEVARKSKSDMWAGMAIGLEFAISKIRAEILAEGGGRNEG